MPMRLVSLWLGMALSMLSACTPERASPAAPTSPANTAPLAGGWSEADPFTPDVQEAARFAVQTFAVHNKARVLYKDVGQARQQVVAGINLELRLQVTLDGVRRTAQATVWRQPDGRYSLADWRWLD
jgi:hypothetical protein